MGRPRATPQAGRGDGPPRGTGPAGLSLADRRSGERTMKTTANPWLSREEIRELMTPSDLRGLLSVVTTWGLIALSFALLVFVPIRPLAWVLAIVLLGGRQLALAILMHECAHGSLFRTR